MLKPSKLQLAALVLGGALATASHASGGSLGDVPPAVSFSNTISGAFQDEWTFNLPVAATVTAGAFNVSFEFGSTSIGSILGFQAWLDGAELFGPTSVTAQPGGFMLKTQTKAGVAPLPSGIHTVTVKGTGVTGGIATYSGYVQAVPVPEPETYALFAAGLGIVGFVASRRRRDH